jgi:hypothetical protein
MDLMRAYFVFNPDLNDWGGPVLDSTKMLLCYQNSIILLCAALCVSLLMYTAFAVSPIPELVDSAVHDNENKLKQAKAKTAIATFDCFVWPLLFVGYAFAITACDRFHSGLMHLARLNTPNWSLAQTVKITYRYKLFIPGMLTLVALAVASAVVTRVRANRVQLASVERAASDTCLLKSTED